MRFKYPTSFEEDLSENRRREFGRKVEHGSRRGGIGHKNLVRFSPGTQNGHSDLSETNLFSVDDLEVGGIMSFFL
jgi:hypothetical protein